MCFGGNCISEMYKFEDILSTQSTQKAERRESTFESRYLAEETAFIYGQLGLSGEASTDETYIFNQAPFSGYEKKLGISLRKFEGEITIGGYNLQMLDNPNSQVEMQSFTNDLYTTTLYNLWLGGAQYAFSEKTIKLDFSEQGIALRPDQFAWFEQKLTKDITDFKCITSADKVRTCR